MCTHNLSPKILASHLRELASDVEALAEDWLQYDHADMATGRHGTVDWHVINAGGGPESTWALREIATELRYAALNASDLNALHAEVWLISNRLMIVRDALYRQVSREHWGNDEGDETYAERAELLWDRLQKLADTLEVVAPLPYGGPDLRLSRRIPSPVLAAMGELSERDRDRVHALRDLAPTLTDDERDELVRDYGRQIAYRLALLDAVLNAAEAEVQA